MIEVRKLALTDKEKIIALHHRYFGYLLELDEYFTPAGSIRHLGFVAEQDGQFLGYLLGHICFETADLDYVFVDSPWRGLGISTLLLAAFLNNLHNGGCEKVLLEVRPSNHGARRLYEKFGFLQISQRPSYYPDGEAALILEKRWS